MGSVFALALALAVRPAGWVVQSTVAAVVTAASVWSSHPFSHAGDDQEEVSGDPGWVVIDEAAGTLLATIGLSAPAALGAWVVFRLADIFKRAFPGVAAAERLGGGVGITADDLVAGLYGLAAGGAITVLWGG